MLELEPFGKPVSEAVQDMRGRIVDVCERRFRASMDKWSGSQLFRAAVFSELENAGRRVPWDDVDDLTLRQLEALFDPEPEPEVIDSGE